MTTTTIAQVRAKHAWETAKKIEALEKKPREKHTGHAKKLPMRILTSGLGPALAFVESKKEGQELLSQLHAWIQDRIPGNSDGKSLLDRVVKGDAVFLRRATEE